MRASLFALRAKLRALPGHVAMTPIELKASPLRFSGWRKQNKGLRASLFGLRVKFKALPGHFAVPPIEQKASPPGFSGQRAQIKGSPDEQDGLPIEQKASRTPIRTISTSAKTRSPRRIAGRTRRQASRSWRPARPFRGLARGAAVRPAWRHGRDSCRTLQARRGHSRPVPGVHASAGARRSFCRRRLPVALRQRREQPSSVKMSR